MFKLLYRNTYDTGTLCSQDCSRICPKVDLKYKYSLVYNCGTQIHT